MSSVKRIKTRILIISDTHGHIPLEKHADAPSTDDEFDWPDVKNVPMGFRYPLPEADVVLHCGDLTLRSDPIEFAQTFSMLRKIRAPLKLAIAGNHDMALDREYWAARKRSIDPHMQMADEAQNIIEDAKVDGVRYLDEGDYTFDLANGARLRVYASQYTPEFGGWGFQYDSDGHDFMIPDGVDVAMTHGPPRGILDYAGYDGTKAGCDFLFRSVHRAKPRIHCFGHIHEAWGAYLAHWQAPSNDYDITAKSVIDTGKSKVIKKLPGLRPTPHTDNEASTRAKIQHLKQLTKDRAINVDISEGEHQVHQGEQTLFVNAAIMSIRYRPVQSPWLIDLDLPETAEAA
jgi:hypothetical protein